MRPFIVPRRRGRLRYPVKRGAGQRVECERCGEWCRVSSVALELGIHATCSCCVLDDVLEAIMGIPVPQPRGQSVEMGRWDTREPTVWSNSGRGEETKQ